jgi:hypothetical protein
MTARLTTDPVSDGEVLAALETIDGTEYVFAIGKIAFRIWRNRGGQGDYDLPHLQPEPRVPIVSPHHAEKAINRLIERGEIGVVRPGDRDEYDIRYYSGPRAKATYYGRTAYLAAGRQKRAEAKRGLAAAVAAADPLRESQKFTSVTVERDGTLTLRVTVEQASALIVDDAGTQVPQ